MPALEEGKPRPVKMIPVKSSNIAKIGYEETTKELFVLFHTNQVYVYSDVPLSRATELMAAKSHGQYLAQFIKDQYSYEKIDKAPSWLSKDMPKKKG